MDQHLFQSGDLNYYLSANADTDEASFASLDTFDGQKRTDHEQEQHHQWSQRQRRQQRQQLLQQDGFELSERVAAEERDDGNGSFLEFQHDRVVSPNEEFLPRDHHHGFDSHDQPARSDHHAAANYSLLRQNSLLGRSDVGTDDDDRGECRHVLADIARALRLRRISSFSIPDDFRPIDPAALGAAGSVDYEYETIFDDTPLEIQEACLMEECLAGMANVETEAPDQPRQRQSALDAKLEQQSSEPYCVALSLPKSATPPVASPARQKGDVEQDQCLWVLNQVTWSGTTTSNSNIDEDELQGTEQTRFKHWSEEEDSRLKHAMELEYRGIPGDKKDWKNIADKYFFNVRSSRQCKIRWNYHLRPGVVRGCWEPHEDEVILKMVSDGAKWFEIAEQLPGRTGEHIRQRYVNALKPSLKKTPWTLDEDRILFEAQTELGNRWTEIGKRLPGRAENSIKNRFHNRQSSERRKLTREAKEREEDGCLDPLFLSKRISGGVEIFEI